MFGRRFPSHETIRAAKLSVMTLQVDKVKMLGGRSASGTQLGAPRGGAGGGYRPRQPMPDSGLSRSLSEARSTHHEGRGLSVQDVCDSLGAAHAGGGGGAPPAARGGVAGARSGAPQPKLSGQPPRGCSLSVVTLGDTDLMPSVGGSFGGKPGSHPIVRRSSLASLTSVLNS